MTLVNNNNESRGSTYFVENGRYIKGRNANLGYTIPTRIFGNKIDRIRLYVQAENMFIIKDRKGLDQSDCP